MKLDITAFYASKIKARAGTTTGAPLNLDMTGTSDYPGDVTFCIFTHNHRYSQLIEEAINHATEVYEREIEAERTRQAEAENYQRIFGEPMPVIDQEEPDSLTPEEPF